MTDQELKDLVASLAVQSKETERILKESGQETDRQFRETDRIIKELGQQIGGLGNKFGTFTEGLAGASIKRILKQRLGCDHVSDATESNKGGLMAEIDYMGSINGGENKVFVVEVKSHLREKHFKQMDQIMANFATLFPTFKGYTLEGMFAVVSASDELEQEVLSRGYHLARGAEEVFELADPPDFVPRRVKV